MNAVAGSGQGPLLLDSSAALPEEFLLRLLPYRREFQRRGDIDQVLKHREIQAISEDLRQYLKGQDIRVYHCTKQARAGFFETRGLRLTDIDSHQQEFLAEFSPHFTAEELTDMRRAWVDHFSATQRKNRNGKVWACLSMGTVVNSGAADLLAHFGGESIYFPLKQHPTIAPKLQALGEPVVVEFSTSGANLNEFGNLAMPLLEGLHREWSSRGLHPQDYVGYQTVSVPPENILAVTPFVDFQRSVEACRMDRRNLQQG